MNPYDPPFCIICHSAADKAAIIDIEIAKLTARLQDAQDRRKEAANKYSQYCDHRNEQGMKVQRTEYAELVLSIALLSRRLAGNVDATSYNRHVDERYPLRPLSDNVVSTVDIEQLQVLEGFLWKMEYELRVKEQA